MDTDLVSRATNGLIALVAPGAVNNVRAKHITKLEPSQYTITIPQLATHNQLVRFSDLDESMAAMVELRDAEAVLASVVVRAVEAFLIGNK